MIPILVLCLAVLPMGACVAETDLPQIDHVDGRASQYAQGVMDRVVRLKVRWGDIDLDSYHVVHGFVAVPECDRMGDIVLARPVGQSHWEAFVAVDCGGPDRAYHWMKNNNIIVEVDYNTARRWDTVGRMIDIQAIE